MRTATQEGLDEYENDDVIPALLWQMIRLKVREQSLKYAADKKQNSIGRKKSRKKNKRFDSNHIG